MFSWKSGCLVSFLFPGYQSHVFLQLIAGLVSVSYDDLDGNENSK